MLPKLLIQYLLFKKSNKIFVTFSIKKNNNNIYKPRGMSATEILEEKQVSEMGVFEDQGYFYEQFSNVVSYCERRN